MEGFSVSRQQRRLWSLRRHGDVFRCRATLRVTGPPTESGLRPAVEAVAREHSILRTRFERLGGMAWPVQVVEQEPRMAWSRHDLSGLSGAALRSSIDRRFGEASETGFDLLHGPLVCGVELDLGPDTRILRLELPALIADPASLIELSRLLALALGGAPLAPGGEEPLQYAQYCAWQEALAAATGQDEAAAWTRLSTSAAAVRVPLERAAGSADESFRPERVSRSLGPDLSVALTDLGEGLGVGAGSLLLAGWQATVLRMTGGADVPVAGWLDGREGSELLELLGPCGAYLPVPSAASAGESLEEWGLKVGRARQAAAVHQHAVCRDGEAASDQRWTLGFDFAPDETAFEADGYRVVVEEVDHLAEPFALRLIGRRRDGELGLEIELDPTRFARAGAERLAGAVVRLLEDAVERPGTPVDSLRLVDGDERQRVLSEAAGKLPDRSFRPVHRRFEEWARRRPDHPALRRAGRELSYGELDARAEGLARRLLTLGVGVESRLGILLPMSFDLVVAVLAVLKTGAAYLPLDPGHPVSRLRYLVEDAGVDVLVTRGDVEAASSVGAPTTLRLDELAEDGVSAAAEPVAGVVPPESLAYLVYTSGSTGLPREC